MLSQSQGLFSSVKTTKKKNTRNQVHIVTNECKPILRFLEKLRDVCINPAWRLLVTSASEDDIRPRGVQAMKDMLGVLTDTSSYLNDHLIKETFETVQMICIRRTSTCPCFRDDITRDFYEILSNAPSIYDGHVHYKWLEMQLDSINKQLNAKLIPPKQALHPGL